MSARGIGRTGASEHYEMPNFRCQKQLRSGVVSSFSTLLPKVQCNDDASSVLEHIDTWVSNVPLRVDKEVVL